MSHVNDQPAGTRGGTSVSNQPAGARAKGGQGGGAPSKSAGRKIVKKMNGLATKYGNDATRVPDASSNPASVTGASAFPTRLYNHDNRDDYEEIKTGLVKTNGLGTPFGQAVLQDSDIAWLKSKRDAMQRADFEVWLTKMFDLTNPSHVQILERVYPEYFSRRLAKLEEDAELQLRLAKIRLHGGSAVDKEDLMLIYGIQSGHVQVPTQALWKPEAAGSPYANADYKRGIFSPFKLQVPFKYPGSGAFMDMITRGSAGSENSTGAISAFPFPVVQGTRQSASLLS